MRSPAQRRITIVEPLQSSRGRFPETQWSLVLAAGGPGSTAAAPALERLCALYWYPIFAFVRRQGHPLEDAQDLTQSFFTRLIDKGDLAAADRARGRFRSFLLTACQHFLLNERDRMAAVKRGGGRVALPIDIAALEERHQRSLAHDETPEHLYERQWCLTLLASVLDAVRAEYAAAGNEELFVRLRGYLTMDDAVGTHAHAAAELRMTPGAVKVAVHRLRRRYRDVLRQRVAETVHSTDALDEAVDDELRHLLTILSAV